MDNNNQIFNQVNFTVTEGNSGVKNCKITVSLKPKFINLAKQIGPKKGLKSLIINYDTLNGTAQSGSDYISTKGSFKLTINDLNVARIINVPIKGDKVIENNESFYLRLSTSALNNTYEAKLTATITNDDKQKSQNNLLGNQTMLVGKNEFQQLSQEPSNQSISQETPLVSSREINRPFLVNPREAINFPSEGHNLNNRDLTPQATEIFPVAVNDFLG